MTPMKLLIFLLFLYVCSCETENDRPIVKTPLGKIKGYHKTASNGRTFSAFEGIPFAKPPIGKRRFEAPEPAEPWTGIWDAIFVSQCAQTSPHKPNTLEGEEDCLYVNVYVPREKPTLEEKLNVIVHIHGGAFMYGSGHSYAHPDFLMDKDVIFVTFNYRLGILGFLSTENEVVPGNNGLKDQVLALKWVQKNIASFGGNPKSVTLTGLSAGGASVHLHYLSPLSKGLFHRGFSQSGVALNPWTIQEEPLIKAKRLAKAVGCPNSDTRIFVACMKERHYRHLVTKTSLFFGYSSLPIAPFAPVIEKGSDAFLNKNPIELLIHKRVEDLPWIVSNTVHEGLLPAAFFYKDLKTIDEKWIDVAPFFLDYNYTLPRKDHGSVAEKAKKHYFGEDSINSDNFLQFVQMFSDRLFLADTEIAIQLQAMANKSPVYYYRFGYPGDHSMNKTVSHGDDGQYFFHNMFQRQEISPNELKMKDVMIDMLVSYAKTGKPNIVDIVWEPTDYEKLTYLKIDGFETKNISLETVDYSATKGFWKSLGFKENENLIQTGGAKPKKCPFMHD